MIEFHVSVITLMYKPLEESSMGVFSNTALGHYPILGRGSVWLEQGLAADGDKATGKIRGKALR
jgi:hypothetical protein